MFQLTWIQSYFFTGKKVGSSQQDIWVNLTAQTDSEMWFKVQNFKSSAGNFCFRLTSF